MNEEDALFFIQKEPWICDCVQHLCLIGTFVKVVFGKGSRQKNSIEEESDVDKKDTSGLTNLWFCQKNVNKWCTEGCIVNLVYHLNAKEEANEFKRISNMSHHDLLGEMGVTRLPAMVEEKES